MLKPSVDVMLLFRAMPRPFRVVVSPRQLYFLDRHTVRTFAPDGTVVYELPRDLTMLPDMFEPGHRLVPA